jgi:hypothetical protein
MATNTVHIDSHAAATLRYIRASMEAAASLAVPGSAGHAMGAVGIVASVLASSASLAPHWLAIWLTAAAIAASVGTVLVFRPASLRALAATSSPARKFALCLFPAPFGGAVMTAVLWANGLLAAIPGTWLLFYGCGLIAASVATNAKIAVMGTLFVALGLIAFAAPPPTHSLLLGLGFGGLHVLFGFVLGRSSHGTES